MAVSESRNQQDQQAPKSGKKKYEKPSFRSEKVFETMALACGKAAPTQSGCLFNRKKS